MAETKSAFLADAYECACAGKRPNPRKNRPGWGWVCVQIRRWIDVRLGSRERSVPALCGHRWGSITSRGRPRTAAEPVWRLHEPTQVRWVPRWSPTLLADASNANTSNYLDPV